ncbi:hypothetical protein ACU686_02655 [Yinghuangia aomiensis]
MVVPGPSGAAHRARPGTGTSGSSHVGTVACLPAGPRRLLVVTADVRLLDELLRMCAVANVEPEVVPHPQLAGEGWAVSPLVVVGADLADGVASFRLPRRKDVVLVSADLDDADVWRRAVVVGADHAGLPAGCRGVADRPGSPTWRTAPARRARDRRGRRPAARGRQDAPVRLPSPRHAAAERRRWWTRIRSAAASTSSWAARPSRGCAGRTWPVLAARWTAAR